MAAVLEALAHYVKTLIADMAAEEVHMLLGVSDEINKLESTTKDLKCFFADAERRRITDQIVQRWVTKLKGAMYDATDILDLCRLEADKRKESKGHNMIEENVSGWFWPLFWLWKPAFSHEIGSRIKELNQKLDEIHKEANRFHFSTINLGSNPEPRKPTDAEVSSRRTTPEFIQLAIVGDKIEKDKTELAQELITNNGNLKIKLVSIVGMGGIGKTTLAQKIFKEKTIQDHFKMKIWVSITQHFDETELLRTAIKQAGGDHGQEKDKTVLTQTFTNILSKNRFLLVMDDVWSLQAWEYVLSVPIINASNEQPGCRVIITSRFQDLACKMQVDFHQHHVSPLDDEDAWSLLKKQLSPNKLELVDQLKGIGKEILQKCDGLPLAVKLMGGVLSSRYPNVREWQDVLHHPAWSVAGLPKELDNRIYLSYEDLSPQLRQCFLYCSLFPRGKTIYKYIITSMWVSEGFIQTESGTSSHNDGFGLEEVASEYYVELIRRNLIEPEDQSTGYKCTMHDVVRSFAEFVAKEEMLVVVHDRQATASGGAGPIRRLCIGHKISEAIDLANFLKNQKSLRTLIIMSRATSFKPADLPSQSFCFLRVLYIRQADFGSLVHFLCQLKHLRCLYLEKTDISRLPDDIDKLKLLQHIFLIDCKNFDYLPNNIIKLQDLRLLHLPLAKVNIVPKGFGGLTSLRTLYDFPVHMDNDGNGGWCSIEEIGPLSQLRDLSIQGIENIPASSSWAEKAMMSNKRHLRYVDLQCGSSRYKRWRDETENQQQQQAIKEALEELSPPSCIENLLITGYFGRQLPNWMMVHATGAFESLRFLTLSKLPCCKKLPDGLCRLPCLESLDIQDAPVIKRVGPEFQASSSSSTGFRKLRNLSLMVLCEWEDWEWEERVEDVTFRKKKRKRVEDVTADAMAMPSLEILTIKNCKLGRLPPGLASSKRHALRRMNLYQLTNLRYVENFPSVVYLDVYDCPELKRIGRLPRLHQITIICCPNLEALEGVPALDSIELWDNSMETLPGYLKDVNPRYLKLSCSRKLAEGLLILGSSEGQKIGHIQQRDIYCTE